MDDIRPDDPTPSPDSGKPKREPPTIDLKPSEVTSSTSDAGSTSDASSSSSASASSSRPSSSAVPSFLVAAVTGAIAAALVVAVAWAMGWTSETARPIAETNTNAIAALSSRIAELEGRLAKPAAADPALSSRLEAIEKSLAALKSDVTGARARSDKLAADLDAVKSAPPSSVAAAPATPVDLSPIEARIAEVERAVRAEGESIAQATSKPADDTALRRLVVASMLEISVRQGEPFVQALKAAQMLAADPQKLKPLESFAGSGVPNAANLCRELLTLVPQLDPPLQETATTSGSGLVGRLKAGAANLVRIERTDAVGNTRGAIVARATAAALRNDAGEARRELMSLTPADRAPAQGWLDKAAGRDAALSATRQFATEAMAVLAKPTP